MIPIEDDVNWLWKLGKIAVLCISSLVAVQTAVAQSVATATAASPSPRIQFNRDIRPIFSDTCFKCHGFDKAGRKGDLRLDVADEAIRPHKKGTPIVPGHPELSEAYQRLISTDPDRAMPPPDSRLTLTAPQKDLLKAWILQGAQYQPHWAFIPVQAPPVPAVKSQGFVKNPIDAFVLAKLEAERLDPSAPADPRRLIRRVTLDLTGVPPTLAETDAFVNDHSPQAYARLVDRLLASARYGERMASDWLDLARFADTHGFQADRYRAMWPYRDWVIKAFNQNLPFDQFGTWQIAGDLLPNATKEQRLATAFNRLHMQNEEGGIVEEEFRCAYVMDRADTFGTAFLGLTVGCAHCHDHKFDPITQKDYYSLFAFFQNVDESGQTSFFTNSMPVPTLLLSTDAQDAQLRTLQGQIAAGQQRLEALRSNADIASVQQMTERAPAPTALSGLVGDFSFGAIKDGKIANRADPSKPGIAVEGPRLVDGKFGQAAELSGENGFRFPGVGHFSRVDPFSLGIWVQTPTVDAPRMVVVHHSKAPIDAGSRGYELLLENGKVAFGLHHMWPGNSLKVLTRQAIPANQWTHVAVSYDGSSRASGVRIYINGKPAELETIRDGLFKDITYENGEPDLAIGYRFRDNGFKGGRVDEFRVFNRAITALEAQELAGTQGLTLAWNTPADKRSAGQREGLLDYFISCVSPEAAAARTTLHAARKAQSDLVNPISEVMVMQELPKPKPAYVLKRGQYDAHGDEVFADTPRFLGALPADQPHNRLALARWVFAPANPLASRVEVNRLWQQMFGRGIVESSENFGSQGTYPTHPELLDWLASDFMQSGWDVKHILRLIALSATYQQSSRTRPQMLERDPQDQLLARAPARRLTAEMFRDQALADSGLLVEKIGGPSVRPYQPDGLWDLAAGNPSYGQGHGADLYRRSLYTFWKRTVPPPAMMTFDAADRSYCTARRQSTSTPLQALALLNDIQITEAAKLISQRMLKEGGATPDGRISYVFRLMTNLEPSPGQLVILRNLLDEQRQIFAADPASAQQLVSVGEAKVDPSLDKVDLAAGTVLAEALFNFDDTMMRR